MNIEEYRDYCLGFKGVSETFPFDNETLVFKVMGKMFALTHVNDFGSITLKCDQEKAVILREQYKEVDPGYHMNKKFWNTIRVDGKIPDPLLKEWIRDSYRLVVEGLPKKQQKQLDD